MDTNGEGARIRRARRIGGWIAALALWCCAGAAAAQSLSILPATLPGMALDEAYEQRLSVSGSTDLFHFTVEDGALPEGLGLDLDGRLHGTPTAAGSYAFTVVAAPAVVVGLVPRAAATVAVPLGGTYRDYTVVVAAPAAAAITLTPPTLPPAVAGTAYDTPVTAAGGAAPYAFTLVAGALPPGLALQPDGSDTVRIAGTPSLAGRYAFTLHAADARAGSADQAYDLVVAAPPPVAAADEATTPAEHAIAIAVTANDAGDIAGVALAAAPAHGVAVVDGLGIVYTPSGTFFGDDSFSYTASGPGGVSAPATVVVHVTPLDAPTGVAQAVSTPAGQAVAIHAADGATGGPITAVSVVAAPATGSVAVDGTDLVYTPPAEASGVVQVVYTLSNAYGTSAPVTSTVTVAPVPRINSHHATTPMGVAVDIDLTGDASGGPFVSAEIVALSPAGAGTASIVATGGGESAGFVLRYAPASGFLGVATATFVVRNAQAASAPATATIDVVARPDPAADPVVGTLVRAQVAAVRSFADAQVRNVQERLEALHDPGVRPWNLWVGGTLRHGDRDGDGATPALAFETSGVSGGADYRFSDRFAFGGALGYGQDRTRIGRDGSRSDARAKSGLAYASFHPRLPFFFDALGGHQRLTFVLQRHDAATGALLEAPREGTQDFSAWSGGYRHKGDTWSFSSYARMEVARARLDEYAEQGPAPAALSFDAMTVETRTSTVGVRGRFSRSLRWGTLEPKFRIELQRDLHDGAGATIRYADAQGAAYVLPGAPLDRNRAVVELGAVFKSRRGYVVRLELRSLRGGTYDNDNAVSLSFQDER